MCMSILFQLYEFPPSVYTNRLQLRYVSSSGYARSRTIYGSRTTSYTLTGLSFGETYNISLRAQVRFSNCYSYLYGEYSEEVSALTIETGKYIANS